MSIHPRSKYTNKVWCMNIMRSARHIVSINMDSTSTIPLFVNKFKMVTGKRRQVFFITHFACNTLQFPSIWSQWQRVCFSWLMVFQIIMRGRFNSSTNNQMPLKTVLGHESIGEIHLACATSLFGSDLQMSKISRKRWALIHTFAHLRNNAEEYLNQCIIIMTNKNGGSFEIRLVVH